MGRISVIVRSKDTEENRDSLYGTVHNVGRIMSRTQAADRMNRKARKRAGGQISIGQMTQATRGFGISLRGAGADESGPYKDSIRKFALFVQT